MAVTARVALALVPIAPRQRRPQAVYVRYEGPERACEHCGPEGSHKRALFYDRKRHRHLCAKCMVRKMDANEAEP